MRVRFVLGWGAFGNIYFLILRWGGFDGISFVFGWSGFVDKSFVLGPWMGCFCQDGLGRNPFIEPSPIFLGSM